MDIGKRFYYARTKYNKHGEETPRKVYKETGVTASSIELYESNKRLPNTKNAQKLADHYGVNVLWLMGKSGSRSLNEDSQLVTKITGLSSDAVEQLCSLSGREKACLDALLTSRDFQNSLYMLSQAKKVSQKMEKWTPTKDMLDDPNAPRTADDYADMIEASTALQTAYAPPNIGEIDAPVWLKALMSQANSGNLVSDRQLVQVYRYQGLQYLGKAFTEYAPAENSERKEK